VALSLVALSLALSHERSQELSVVALSQELSVVARCQELSLVALSQELSLELSLELSQELSLELSLAVSLALRRHSRCSSVIPRVWAVVFPTVDLGLVMWFEE
jgi:hypothetical protein